MNQRRSCKASEGTGLTRPNPTHFMAGQFCERSTMDSVVASEAIDVGSIPAARTNSEQAVEKLSQRSLGALDSKAG